jgi:flavin-dependent dehydrogenase
VERFDAIVVGAGPAGGALALLLARAGARVALVEKSSIPRDVVCGEFVSEEGVAVLRRLGVESPGATRIDGVRLFDAEGSSVAAPDAHGIGWSRRDLDAALVAAAVAAGATLRERTIAEAPMVDAGRVRGVRVRRREGADEWLAPVVVAADGRKSTLARALGARRESLARARSLFGFRAHADGAVAGGRTVDLFLFEGGYAGTCAVAGGLTNLAFVVEQRRLREASPRAILDGNAALRERLRGVAPASTMAVGPLVFGPRALHRAGVLFVGDASGPVDPFVGEGISIALESACLAAPVALEAIARGGVDAALADRYERDHADRIASRQRSARVLSWMLSHAPSRAFLLATIRRPSIFRRVVQLTRTEPGSFFSLTAR